MGTSTNMINVANTTPYANDMATYCSANPEGNNAHDYERLQAGLERNGQKREDNHQGYDKAIRQTHQRFTLFPLLSLKRIGDRRIICEQGRLVV
jgi:hypothetical protein